MFRGERLNDGLSVATFGHGSALVFLPGLGQGADLSQRVPRGAVWSARAVATGARRTAHLINRPVDMPFSTSIAELAAWYAVALRERFGRPIDVLGVSAGGVTALQLAMDHPDVVHRLAVQVAASRITDRGRRDLLRCAELPEQGRSAAWVSSGLVAHGPLRPVVAACYGIGRQRRAPGEIALIHAIQTWDVTPRLDQITAPTLIVGGTRDVLAPPPLTRATADGIPNARLLLLPGRGHLTTLLDPRSMRAVRDFLDGATRNH